MKIKSKQYAQALFELTKEKNKSDVDALVLKFVENLKRNSEFKKIDEIIKSFIQIYNRENNIVEAEIMSAKELNVDQLQSVKDFIGKKYESEEVILKNEVDESILGGVSVKVGEEVTDFSIGGQLKQLKNCLVK
ncbi:MAG: ATP synthase F1 subunit delta [Candidatus Moranbacteria bacterium]|nr:ATP synthase F1 subunit delta [Candidatus Moranbacteria bacterium]